MPDPTPSNPSPAPEENRRTVGVFWSKSNERGEPFLAGKVKMKNLTGADEEVGVFVFKNKDKKNPKGPDYTMVLTNDELAKRMPKTNQEEFM